MLANWHMHCLGVFMGCSQGWDEYNEEACRHHSPLLSLLPPLLPHPPPRSALSLLDTTTAATGSSSSRRGKEGRVSGGGSGSVNDASASALLALRVRGNLGALLLEAGRAGEALQEAQRGLAQVQGEGRGTWEVGRGKMKSNSGNAWEEGMLQDVSVAHNAVDARHGLAPPPPLPLLPSTSSTCPHHPPPHTHTTAEVRGYRPPPPHLTFPFPTPHPLPLSLPPLQAEAVVGPYGEGVAGLLFNKAKVRGKGEGGRCVCIAGMCARVEGEEGGVSGSAPGCSHTWASPHDAPGWVRRVGGRGGGRRQPCGPLGATAARHTCHRLEQSSW